MTRMEKYENRRKSLLRKGFELLVFLLKQLIKLISLIVKTTNKIVVKLFNKLPKTIKTIIIYIMLGLAIVGGITIKNETEMFLEKQTETNEVVVAMVEETKTETENVEVEVEEIQEETTTQQQKNFTNKNEENIYNKGIEIGLTHEQALLVVAISKHETGSWTSENFKTHNNFGGVMCATGIKHYETYQEGLEGFVKLLKNSYFDLGLKSIEEIGNKYCPVGAKNDPKGLNKYWIPSVTNLYNNYLESVK